MGFLNWMAGRYYVKEAQRMSDAAFSLPLNTRRTVVLHLVSQMKRTLDAEQRGPSALAFAVREVFQEASRDRQMAVAQGATQRTNPAWCSPALVETWSGARLGCMQGRIRARAFDRVDAVMYDLIASTLTPEELASAIGVRP